MKKNVGIIISIVISLIISLGTSFAFQSIDIQNDLMTPSLNEGKKWRIGYCESEPYVNFAGTLYGIIIGLEDLGWIEGVKDIPYESGQSNSLVMWKWLSSQDLSPYIEFVDDGYYSLGLSEDGTDQQINNRLKTRNDIDLMIVMGTNAGKAIADGEHSVPTMVFSSSNAVKSGIIKSENDSGKNHLWAHMDTERYIRQIKVFHDIFDFKKLGMVYEDSLAGRTFAAVDDVQEIASEKDFEVISYFVDEPKSQEDLEDYYGKVIDANKKLSSKVDSVYFTAAAFREVEKVPQLLEPFYDNNIPVFSQSGSIEVENGALVSLYRSDYNGIGIFGATNISKVLNGTLPRELPQIYGDTPNIVINMEVADMIEYKVPFEILLSADKIFNSIGVNNLEE
ncbi:ABC transporter substrate binding protein [Wukongibacter baidiensis]|uniref:ABC transporter substrate binding protein n=1 Tax=Wukongibacter baidiensis TaxID=1723361 RepID=UPI003D7F582C